MVVEGGRGGEGRVLWLVVCLGVFLFYFLFLFGLFFCYFFGFTFFCMERLTVWFVFGNERFFYY